MCMCVYINNVDALHVSPADLQQLIIHQTEAVLNVTLIITISASIPCIQKQCAYTILQK